MAMLVTSLLNKSPLRQHNVLVTVRKLLTLNFQTTNWRLLGISPSYPHFFASNYQRVQQWQPIANPSGNQREELAGPFAQRWH